MHNSTPHLSAQGLDESQQEYAANTYTDSCESAQEISIEQSLCDADSDYVEIPEKTFVRYNYKHERWHLVYYLRDKVVVSSSFWRPCINCGECFWGTTAGKICSDCGSERRQKLQELSGKACNQVAQAIRDGNLCRLDGTIPCVDCGKPATVYDHREYAKPLDVEPVCRSCNTNRGPALEHVPLVTRLPKKFRLKQQEAQSANA